MGKLLYYAPASYGGLLNYAQEQADAIARLGIDTTVICSANFTKRPDDRFSMLSTLIDSRVTYQGSRLMRSLLHVKNLFKNFDKVKKEVLSGGYHHVLFASYIEYFSPFWVSGYRKLAAKGITFGAVIQEPVRDFRVGPLWWHRWSIAEAYSFLKYAFVHDYVNLDTVRKMPNLQTVVIPYGPHKFPEPNKSRAEVRHKLGIPECAVVLLAFGHIRDNKNLDYAIRALNEIAGSYLIVAGKRDASSQRPESYYQDLASKIGVSDRCKWILEYVSEIDAANYFNACDLVLLTYSSSFRSASGVLHVAARYRKPSIVSSGSGSLQSVVRKYKIGVWVEPDCPTAVADGIKNWLRNPVASDWHSYEKDNSWDTNARIVCDTYFGSI
jgi:glycosyltransferase involved in cell wall biosynthesis